MYRATTEAPGSRRRIYPPAVFYWPDRQCLPGRARFARHQGADGTIASSIVIISCLNIAFAVSGVNPSIWPASCEA